MRTTEGNNNNNNNSNTNPVFGVRDYLLYNLFNGGIIIGYRWWRFIEFVFLIKAILSLILLIYVHIHLSQMPANYLDHLKDSWPRDGILRVEIIPSSQSSHAEQTDAFNELFTLENSYKREYKLKRMDEREETVALFNRITKTNIPENKGDVDIEPSTEELVDNTFQVTNPKPNLFNYLSFKNYIYFEDSWLDVISYQFIDSRSFTVVAGSLIIIIPALDTVWVIMFDTMSVFFNDDETHYHILLIIWVADTYHTKFSRCPITKRHWPRFFYLYHFLFYAYSNRFDGRLNNLALYCSWSFTEHSMFYFYHHYELPYALQRVRPR